MKTPKERLSEKILDYWFTMEFLTQDKYPDTLGIQRCVKKYKEDISKGNVGDGHKSIENFISFTGRETAENLYEIIQNEAVACGMKIWGNLTVYIGKVKREKCIECLAKALPFSEEDGERPEKNKDEIAWASLQLSPEGKYLKYSLSLSTIIWAIEQIKSTGKNISESLDDKRYHEAVEELESIFSDEIVSLGKLRSLYDEIEKRYMKGNIENNANTNDAYEEVYGIGFQLFTDEETKNGKEEDAYSGLSHDFFSDDIKLVLEQVKSGELAENEYLGKDILSYVTALSEMDQEKERVDLVAPKNRDRGEYLQQISEILSVENAPLGKWPSRFMPAFMQQIAINLSSGKGTSELFGKNGKVFSVNGPPGTGKTTLLKEIVVSNIVERAILLSHYDEPDAAFQKHDFLHGSKEEKAYSKYTRHWYSLKNDAINDYSMLVTSCNNAAVENISKELPKSMIKDLAPLSGDSDELKTLLEEVGRLFTPEESKMIEKDSGEKPDYDIYFTEYAQALLDSKDVWGLVAAPLGKKTNLSDFYYKVLYHLTWDFYKSKDMAQKRVESYQSAREKFIRQLNIVRKMQDSLKRAGELSIKKGKAEAKLMQIRAEYESVLEDNKGKIQKIVNQLEKLRESEHDALLKEESCERALQQMVTELQEKEEELKTSRLKRKECLQKEIEIRDSVGGITKLFHKGKYRAAIQLADEYHKDVEELEHRVTTVEEEITKHKKDVECAEELYNRMKREHQKFLSGIEKSEQSVVEADEQSAACKSRMSQAEGELAEIIKACEVEFSKFADSSDMDYAKVIDEKFIEQLLSGDIQQVTDAQVSNPWFTQRYNREREKLFAYAMRMNKEFIVSSNHCRDNFKTLTHYWGLQKGDDNERVIFHKEDKENMLPALFQTLFLLVPVVSSTFASVGSLLRDVKQAGVVGTLVVDEAGQAQPQMALGALFRSRRAIIVGDPKQIQPVVTDELILLRKAYDDDDLKPYKKKTLSVQEFADGMNLFGTYLDNASDYPEWVGCPLLVHRRCISPMYDISNEISYNGIMKQQTRFPKPAQAEKFICDKSRWIQVKGTEKGNKNHFVENQGKKVCELLEIAFSKNTEPSIYIISPFTTVVSGIKDYICRYCQENTGTKINKDYIVDYDKAKIGTVHTFQGKEADEVIFLLGCDESKEAQGAVKWVNKNIVNVAVTRAKFRLYVIGDKDVWKLSSCVNRAKEILDTYAIKEIKAIYDKNIPEQEREEALLRASAGLPSATSFSTAVAEEDSGVIDYSFDTSGFIKGLDETFLETELSEEQLKEFGFRHVKELDIFSEEVRANIVLGMKLFFLLKPVYEINRKMDASCCAILFCKALELQLKDYFIVGLQEIMPEYKIKGGGRTPIALKDARKEEFMLGTFVKIFKDYKEELGQRMEKAGFPQYDILWWSAFEKGLNACRERRNNCCHAGLFIWEEQIRLLSDMFKESMGEKEKKIGGIMFESIVGRKLSIK